MAVHGMHARAGQQALPRERGARGPPGLGRPGAARAADRARGLCDHALDAVPHPGQEVQVRPTRTPSSLRMLFTNSIALYSRRRIVWLGVRR